MKLVFVPPSRKLFSGRGADSNQDLKNHDIEKFLHLLVTVSNRVGPFHLESYTVGISITWRALVNGPIGRRSGLGTRSYGW